MGVCKKSAVRGHYANLHNSFNVGCTSNSQNICKKLYYITLVAESASYHPNLLKWTVAEIWQLYIQGFILLWGPEKPFKSITDTPRKSLDLIYIHLSPGFLSFPCKAHKSWLCSKRKLEWLNSHSLGRGSLSKHESQDWHRDECECLQLIYSDTVILINFRKNNLIWELSGSALLQQTK